MATVPTIISDIICLLYCRCKYTHCGSIVILAVPNTVDGDNSATTVDGKSPPHIWTRPLSPPTHYSIDKCHSHLLPRKQDSKINHIKTQSTQQYHYIVGGLEG